MSNLVKFVVKFEFIPTCRMLLGISFILTLVGFLVYVLALETIPESPTLNGLVTSLCLNLFVFICLFGIITINDWYVERELKKQMGEEAYQEFKQLQRKEWGLD